MRTLNDSERRTVRLGIIVIVVYLVGFFGLRTWQSVSRRQREYQQLQSEARTLRDRASVYREKSEAARSLMEKFRMDPARLSTNTLVADATAAIHQAAMSGGLQFGPIRENAARAASRELAAVQLEGFGPIPSVLGFLHSLGNLGYPLVTESLEIGPDTRQPGQVKINITVLILDFSQWKPSTDRPNA